MSPYEVLSIVSLCVSTFVAVACFLVPIIISAFNARRERREREREFIFEEQYAIFRELANAYANWKSNPLEKTQLLNTIYLTTTVCDYWSNEQLTRFANAVRDNSDKADRLYFECRRALLEFFGIKIYADSPRELIPERLRHNIRKKRKY